MNTELLDKVYESSKMERPRIRGFPAITKADIELLIHAIHTNVPVRYPSKELLKLIEAIYD